MTDPMDKLAQLDDELGLHDRLQNVFLLNYMGDDDAVVDAARVSFDKKASEYTFEQNEKLINYLAKHGHWSPFAHVTLKFQIRAPIFVARQLAKHQVGLAWNEISRRYVDDKVTAWTPKYLRQRAESVKQGSSEERVKNERSIIDFRHAVGVALRTYESLLQDGVCPEQARAVLPQAAYTEWVWTGSLYAFWRVVSQRTTSHAQRETKAIAQEIANHAHSCFPISWRALERNGT
jgi:thymidylate synthase (FAD)